MFNLYQYNSRSEVIDAVRYFGSNTNDTSNPVGLQDWSYSYDNIGNRSGTMKANAAGNYTVNALNQYTERTVHGSADIIGSAEQDVTITVNEAEAARQAYYWYHRLTVDNLFTPIYTQVVVEAIYDPGTNDPYVVSSETGSVFVAESPEVFTYDDDGNLLSDGRFNYSWDAENRLISVETIDGLPEDMPVVHVAFEYDYQSRRVGKTVYQWDAGITNWVEQSSASFLYDGWNLLEEQTLSNDGVTTNHYVFGLDLSGSLQGAGGIGGLLASVSGTNAAFYTYCANGNVSELVNADGEIVAHYEYSPFGETIVATGPLAAENKFRFSTKYFDDETGLAYYGYRYFSPSMGRFISEDPLLDPGSVPVMGIRKYLLGMMEEYSMLQLAIVLNEELSEQQRMIALYRMLVIDAWFASLDRNAPNLWLALTGKHWLAFCSNDGINLFDSLGLSCEDVANIVDIFWERVSWMESVGRRPRGRSSWWSNFTGFYGFTGYWGCDLQANEVRRALDSRGNWDDPWTFSQQGQYFPYPHQWVVATPDNPLSGDPIIILDPWAMTVDFIPEPPELPWSEDPSIRRPY